MKLNKRVLLLIGSPKQQPSTSQSLGTYLIEKMQPQGAAAQTLFVHKSLRTRDRRDNLLKAVNQAHLIVIAFPLYIDCLPSSVIKMMEIVAKDRRQKQALPAQRLVCIVNNGFPEPHQNDTAVAICRQFAKQTGFDWAGSLVLGGGEAINGKPLKEVKAMARNIIKSLDMAAVALSSGSSIPKDAQILMAKGIVPHWLYRWLGKIKWNSDAKKHAVHRKLYTRPFQQ